jgi:hypothetical protein
MMNIQFHTHTFLKIPHICHSIKNFSSKQEPGQKFGSQKILHLHWANVVRNSENISVRDTTVFKSNSQ